MSGQCASPEWQDPPSSNSMGWQNAFNYCETLSFDGHDDWRSPTIGELRSLVRGCPDTETNGPCGLTDDCLSYANCHDYNCDGCPLLEGPSEGCYWPDGMQGTCGYYHSSSLRTGTSLVWSLNFSYADFASHTETGVSTYARCIRYSTQ
ncbi:MAG: DUF1566 domain-containing protein [Deltaproteobacteria bacterium]|nr:DUF1566 domain-containing protein [Deltaproteobacteria bacterium]